MRTEPLPRPSCPVPFVSPTTEREFLDAVRHTARVTETWDVTTIRASVGNYLVSKKVSEVGKDVVMLCGDVSDELFGGYLGFKHADTGMMATRFLDLIWQLSRTKNHIHLKSI